MKLTSVEEADSYITSFCTEYRLDEDTCFKIRLVTEELVTNIFKYTKAKEFILNIIHGRETEISLEYQSGDFDFKIKKPKQKEIMEIEEGGLGLFLVESITKTFRYRHQDGKSIYKLTI